MRSIHKKIPAVQCPGYVKDWINAWSGISCYDVTLEQLTEIKPKTFVTNEDFILSDMENIFQVMERNGIKEMVIHVLHIYKFNRAILEKLDKLAEGYKVHFISMSYKFDFFKNIIAHSYDLLEHAISHDFNYMMSQRLQARRKPQFDFVFMFMVNLKNNFRRRLNDKLEKDGIFKNSYVRNDGPEQYQQLIKKHTEILKSIEAEMPGNQCINALQSWGGTLPDFLAYEKSFCDIVVESTNTSVDDRSDGTLTDLSEKTYRPIALGVPFVFLGSKKMFDKLRADGYQLVDDGEFYDRWHNETDLEKALSLLTEFLKKTITNKEIRKSMESMAEHNYKNFWFARKYQYRKSLEKIFDDCFEENPFNKIYDLLKI